MQQIMNARLKFKKNQKGMTLIELLAVIVILGIIAAIAVPAIGGIINNTKTKADQATEQMIKDAVVTMLLATNVDTTTTPTGTVASLVTGGYLTKAPTWQTYTATNYDNYSASFTGGIWVVTFN